jgi:hypothetical protein
VYQISLRRVLCIGKVGSDLTFKQRYRIRNGCEGPVRVWSLMSKVWVADGSQGRGEGWREGAGRSR